MSSINLPSSEAATAEKRAASLFMVVDYIYSNYTIPIILSDRRILKIRRAYQDAVDRVPDPYMRMHETCGCGRSECQSGYPLNHYYRRTLARD
jgi:hypothetical protein